MSLVSTIKERPFLRNFSVLTVGEFAARAIGMFINILLARYLAPEGYGQYTVVLTYTAILYSLSCLGVNQLTIRHIARNPDNSLFYFRLSLLFRLVGVVLSAIGFVCYARLTHSSISQFLIFIILASVFLENIWAVSQNVAFGMQRMEWNSIVNVLFAFINLVIYLIIPSEWISLETVLVIYILLYFIKDAVYYVCLRKCDLLRNIDNDLNIDKETVTSFLKDSFPFYVLLVFGLLTNQFPSLFLEANSSTSEVAYFGTANKLLLPMTIFFNSALAAFFPNQSVLFEKDRVQFGKQTRRVITILVVTGIVFCIFITLFRNEVVFLLYGDEYKETGNVMALQCWYFVMYAIFCVNGNVLGAANEQKRLSVLSIVYAIVSTPLLYAGSFYGATGISYAYLLASLINIVILFPQIIRVTNHIVSVRYAIFIFILIVVSMVSSLLIPQSISIWIRLITALGICLIILFNRKSILRYFKQ